MSDCEEMWGHGGEIARMFNNEAMQDRSRLVIRSSERELPLKGTLISVPGDWRE